MDIQTIFFASTSKIYFELNWKLDIIWIQSKTIWIESFVLFVFIISSSIKNYCSIFDSIEMIVNELISILRLSSDEIRKICEMFLLKFLTSAKRKKGKPIKFTKTLKRFEVFLLNACDLGDFSQITWDLSSVTSFLMVSYCFLVKILQTSSMLL